MAEEKAAAEPQRQSPEGALLAAALASVSDNPKVDQLLDRQIALADLQIEDMKRDNAQRSWSLRFANISAVMKVAFEIAVAFVLIAIAAMLGAAIWSAGRSDGLVIEAFQVPPSLAAQGLSGEVIAAHFQDKLTRLQEETQSIRAPSSYQNNWGDDIKVEIPNTGVSIGEFYRYLRGWLGHETHINGEVWRTGGGIAVVARSGTQTGATYAGRESDLDSLLEKAAESIYAKTQPYRYAVYLSEQGRTAPALAVLKTLASSSPPSEQAWAYMDWGITLLGSSRDWRKALSLLEAAASRDPDNADVYAALSSANSELDRDEAELRNALRGAQLFARGRADLNPVPSESLRLQLLVNIAEMRGDFPEAARLNAAVSQRPDFAGSSAAAVIERAYDLASAHDAAGAARLERQFVQIAGGDPGLQLELFATQIGADAALNRWGAVVGDRDRFWQAMKQAKPGDAAGFTAIGERFVQSQYALALAETGDFKGAETAIAATPGDCDVCVRTRGRIRAAEGKWAAADYWFARAVKAEPDIPFACEEWGEALLGKGDFDRATARFERAHRIGPHFADPLEMWGEALMQKNRSDLALAKFAEAAKYAPNWGRLHLKWGEALAYTGNKAEAQKQFAVAAHLDLTWDEQSKLAHMKAIHE